MREWIAGRNPVYEVLRAKRRQPFRLLIAENAREKGRLADILTICHQRRLPVERVDKHELRHLDENHQGVALEASGYPYSNLQDMFVLARQRKEPAFFLILDALQDPQNLGTLLRTAEVVGVQGVLIPLRQTATVTPAVVGASAGASEHLLIAQINLAQAIRQIKEAGVWVVGLEGGNEAEPLERVRLDGPIGMVVGSEGEGMRSLVRDSCDVLLRLPMRGKVESLNAAVAGSVALFMAWRARGFHGATAVDRP
jgi:23S rRNA (guanosine2251-2'-O)-methyltransferase